MEEGEPICRGEDYNTKFDPDVYLSSYVSDVTGEPEEGGFMKFNIDCLHEIFAKGDVRGCRLLDVGSGPSIHNVISASKHFDEIYLSDFSVRNRAALKSWREGTMKHSFEKFFQYIVDKEGQGGSPASREKEMKEKVKDVFYVDLLADSWPEVTSRQPYDLILTSLCLEVTAPNIEVYQSIVNRLVSLLKTNGYLIVHGVLEETFYTVSDQTFFTLSLTEAEAKNVYSGGDLETVKWMVNKYEDLKQKFQPNFQGSFVMLAKKIQKT